MSSAANIEELLRHSAWMKRLAQSLAHDRAAAEDLVQDAWEAALKQPPRAGPTVRSWLGQVVRNAQRERIRGGSRAERRETFSAEGAGPAPSVESLVGSAETGRLLAAEVLRLDEPYRSTLLRVFYEGLAPSEIAARDGVPPGTVRWRLKEGLDRLRAQLDQKHGGDRTAWLTVLAPLVGPDPSRFAAGSSSTLKGGLVMKISLATLCAAAVSSAALTLTSPTEAEAPPPSSVPARAAVAPLTSAPAAAASHDQLLAQIVRARQAVVQAPSAVPTLDKDYIRAQIQELRPLLQECYEKALAGQPTLAGKLVVEFTIVGDPSVGGLVGESRIASEDPGLANDGFRECVRETMYGARFTPPPAGGEMKVTYPFVFSNADSVAPK